MAVKFVYTEVEVAEIVTAYKANTSLEVLAEKYNKSVASVRMKLVKLGVYQAKKTVTSAPSKKEINDTFSLCLAQLGPALM